MKLQVQGELFSSAERIAFDATFRGAARTALDASSWVEVVPGWLSGARLLFDALAQGVAWRQLTRTVYHQRFQEPRLTAEYRDLSQAPHAPLIEAAAVLSAHYGVRYDSVWMNLYRDGRDRTGFHRDHFSCRKPECIVPVLSLGAPRRFLVKPRAGGASIAFTPRSGDLVVMGGRSQEDWVHGVPSQAGVLAARISINFMSAEQGRRA